MVHALTSLTQLRETVGQWRAAGQKVALVPTMGALHSGHMQLVAEAKKYADHVVVSIFVNPTQFGPNEDFNRYPRPLERDLSLLAEEGASAAWLPTVDEMYPQGFQTSIHVAGVSEGLDGAFRPGHFDGVATVVTKLLLQVAPDIALFGEKDYQQLCVIRQLVSDLNIPVQIKGVSTVREASGLALSSRNQYLSDDHRTVAAQIHAQLQAAAHALKQAPAEVASTLAQAKQKLLAAGFSKIDYLELREANHLRPLEHFEAPARLLVAAWLGTTRLIDNITVE
jgi:pantoate--beta-alanine ligase